MENTKLKRSSPYDTATVVGNGRCGSGNKDQARSSNDAVRTKSKGVIGEEQGIAKTTVERRRKNPQQKKKLPVSSAGISCETITEDPAEIENEDKARGTVHVMIPTN